ncbi:MAG: PAS domain-containing protein [Breoghania sp.]|nr:PAS domain-containing protein [Breoghania sp.]
MIDFVLLRWRSERTTPPELPPYEHVALGNLGHFADSLALVVQDENGEFNRARVGEMFCKWGGVSRDGAAFSALLTVRTHSLRDAIEFSRTSGEPTRVTTHQVAAGNFETYDLWALPLSSLWGPPVFIIVLDRRDTQYDVLDTMFDATDDGMIALTAIRNACNRAVDFQFVAFNNGAPQLLNMPANRLEWARLSDLGLRLEEAEVVGNLARAVQQGTRVNFEVTYDGENGRRYFKVGASPIGDLVSVTLTDIAEIKERERSFRLLFEGNPNPTWLVASDTLQILHVNEAAVRHYGHARADFLNMSMLDTLHPESRADFAVFLKRLDQPYQGQDVRRRDRSPPLCPSHGDGGSAMLRHVRGRLHRTAQGGSPRRAYGAP